MTLEAGDDEACLLITTTLDKVYELTEELIIIISSVSPDIDINDTSQTILIFDSAIGMNQLAYVHVGHVSVSNT